MQNVFFCAGEVCLMSFSLVSGKRTFDEPHAQQIWSKSSWQTALGKCCLRATNCHHTWAMMLPEKSRGGGMDFINDACQICMTTYACVHACTCTYTHVSANYLCVCVCGHRSFRFVLLTIPKFRSTHKATLATGKWFAITFLDLQMTVQLF